MKLYTALILIGILSSASGLRCYICAAGSTKCEAFTCPALADRCSTVEVNGVTAKNCHVSTSCVNPIKCCEGDLCNSAITTGSSVLLLLLSSAIMTVFL